MKTEDIERLKKICEENGFEVSRFWEDGPLFQVTKKDPWNGVEFYRDHLGIVRIMTDRIGQTLKNGVKLLMSPSTESEYFEQLKKEAFERFGGIKQGDRFERDWESGIDERYKFTIGDRGYTKDGFTYYKEADSLMFDGHSIYKSGKWATKLPEKVKVEWKDWEYVDISGRICFEFDIRNKKWSDVKDRDQLGECLAKQLENYLNDNQE